MIGIGPRSRPLLVGLTVSALLVGVVVLARPDIVHPADLSSTPVSAPASATARTPPAPTTGPAGAAGRVAAGVARPTPTVSRRMSRPSSAPAPAPAPARVQAAAVGGSQTAQVVALTNQARARAGCDALRVDPRLTAAAQGHSADMAANDYFDHDGLDGSSFADRIEAQGYPSPGGENIAWGQQRAREVVTDWMNSPSHRVNIEDCSFTTIGVGLAGARKYWTQDFGR